MKKRVGLYIHIPFCVSKCAYCGFYSQPIHLHNPKRLVKALLRQLKDYEGISKDVIARSEATKQSSLLPQTRDCFAPLAMTKCFKTIYIGGGTPSALPHEELTLLLQNLQEFLPDVDEFTVEVNPADVNTELLTTLKKYGVNRLSIGAQSFVEKELKLLGRRHSPEQITEAVRLASDGGFENINLDLIFAVPNSTLDSLKYSLKKAVELRSRHISAYSLTYEKDTPLQAAVEAGKIERIDEETDRQMYEFVIDFLAEHRIFQYEISNFAAKGFQCLHNLNYWDNGQYAGIGPAAGFYFGGKRGLNIADIDKYIEAVENNRPVYGELETPDKIEIACQTAVLNLRTMRGIDFVLFKERTDFDLKELFKDVIEKNKQSGMISESSGRIFLTRQALPIADSVLCDFASAD